MALEPTNLDDVPVHHLSSTLKKKSFAIEKSWKAKQKSPASSRRVGPRPWKKRPASQKQSQKNVMSLTGIAMGQPEKKVQLEREINNKKAEGAFLAIEVVETKCGEGEEESLYYKAMHDFQGQEAGDLSLSVGDILQVQRADQAEDGWWKGVHVKTGQSGVFPSNFCTPFAKPMSPVEHNDALPSTTIDGPRLAPSRPSGCPTPRAVQSPRVQLLANQTPKNATAESQVEATAPEQKIFEKETAAESPVETTLPATENREEERAATMIQCQFRRKKSINQVCVAREQRKEQNVAAAKIQEQYKKKKRGEQQPAKESVGDETAAKSPVEAALAAKDPREEERAATMIQCQFRRKQSFNQVSFAREQRKEENTAAAKIQAQYKKKRAEEEVKEQNVAASKIQSRYRKRSKEKIEMEEQNVAASKIQNKFRKRSILKAEQQAAATKIQSEFRRRSAAESSVEKKQKERRRKSDTDVEARSNADFEAGIPWRWDLAQEIAEAAINDAMSAYRRMQASARRK